MAKNRSPNYPALSLAEAVEAIRPAFKIENRHRMPRLLLAKHLGYGSLNGRALGKIGALRAYGLIEGSADELRFTEDAITALEAPGPAERRAALERCALRPSLFKDLRELYPDTLPSLDNLRFELIRRRFTPEAAGKAAETYLATMRLVSGSREDYVGATPDDEGPDMQRETPTVRTPPPPPPKQGAERAEFPLPEGVVRLEFPSVLSQASFEDLEAWTQLVLRRAKRSVRAPSDDGERSDH